MLDPRLVIGSFGDLMKVQLVVAHPREEIA